MPEQYQSAKAADSAPFIEFMLTLILQHALQHGSAQQVTQQVEQLLRVLKGEMSAAEIREALKLKDRESFRSRWLLPALEQKVIEMTIPEKPRSRMQKYRKKL